MRFTSVNSKLVLMTLGGMAFTLLLMAGMLNFSILDHHKQLAAQQTQKHLTIVQNEIKSLQLKMQEKANRIASKTEVIASLSLLNNYQGQFSQESVMFEQEKQKLRAIIYDEVQNSHLDGGELFDHQDQLLAFVESRQDSFFSGIQVKAGHDWLLKNELNQPLSEFNQSIMSELNQFLNHQAIKDREPATRAHLHGSELHLEFYHPIYRTYPGGNKAWQGTVVLKKYLNTNYFQQINVDRLVNTIIVNSQGQAISNNQVFDKQLPKLLRAHLQSIVDQKSLGQTDQIFFSVEPFDLDAAGSDFVFIVSTYPLSEYHHQVKQARLSMLWAGLISFLAALPIVYWYSRKSFQKPLNTIKQTTRAYEAGDYQASIEINSQDEFTEVAHAMQNMARKVEEREDELQTLIKHLPVIVFAKEAQHLSFTQFNATAENILGLKRDDLIGKNDFDLFPFEQAQSFVQKDREVLKQGRVLDIPLEAIQTPNGLKWLHTRKVPVCDRNGKPLYLLGVSLDITQELAQQKEQQRWDIIFENMSEAIILTDHNGIIQRVNTAFETITGYLADEVIGERPSKIKSGKHDILFYENLWSQLLRTGKWSGEIWNRTKAGDEFPVWESIAAIYDEKGAFLNYVGIFSDIGEIKASREEIDFLAYHDALTGLPNRIHFNEHLKHAIADAKRNKRILAVCFIDLDRFKNINDSLGHQVGDELLKSISQKLTSLIRETDVLSRQGGDEFLLLLENIPGRESVKTVLKK